MFHPKAKFSVKLDRLSASKILLGDRHRIGIPILKGQKGRNKGVTGLKQVNSPEGQILLGLRTESNALGLTLCPLAPGEGLILWVLWDSPTFSAYQGSCKPTLTGFCLFGFSFVVILHFVLSLSHSHQAVTVSAGIKFSKTMLVSCMSRDPHHQL